MGTDEDLIKVFCEKCMRSIGTLRDNHYFELVEVVSQAGIEEIKEMGPVCRDCLKREVLPFGQRTQRAEIDDTTV